MTDRELLELAAKAAGSRLRIIYSGDGKHYEIDTSKATGRNTSTPWNPLTDDGDALRLAVKLRIVIDRSEVKPATFCYCDYRDQVTEGVVEDHGDDPYAATRRAIVRAAAEIGKESK